MLVLSCLFALVAKADNYTLSSGSNHQDFTTLQMCLDAIKNGTVALSGDTYTILLNNDVTETGSNTLEYSVQIDGQPEKNEYLIFTDLYGKSAIKKIIIDGNSHSMSSTITDEPDATYGLINTAVVINLHDGGTLEVRNMTINNHIKFKPVLNCVKHRQEPKSDLYMHDCVVTGRMYCHCVPFREGKFENCRFTVGSRYVLWVNFHNPFSYNHKIVMNNNYIMTDRCINTAAHNYKQYWSGEEERRKRIDLEITNNTVIMPDGASGGFALVQNTDDFGNVEISGNKILGDFVPNAKVPQCIVMQYVHGNAESTNHFFKPERSYSGGWYDDGEKNYMYDSSCSINIHDNYIQCGFNVFQLGGLFPTDKSWYSASEPVNFPKAGYQVMNLDELTPWQKGWYTFGNMSNNVECHHFSTKTADHQQCHFCPVCDRVIISADKDGYVMQDGVDINTKTNSILSWNDVTDKAIAPYSEIKVGNNLAPNGVLLEKNQSATFTFKRVAPEKGNGYVGVYAAKIKDHNLTKTELDGTYTWTNNIDYTYNDICPYFAVEPRVKLVIPANNYTTFSSANDVDFAGAKDDAGVDAGTKFKGYRATKYNYQSEEVSQLYYTSTAALPKTEGALVNGEAGTYWLPILDSCPIFSSDNGMKVGNCHLTAGNDNIFVLASSPDNPLGLYRLGVDVDVPFGYSYLDLSGITVTSGSGSGSKAYRLSFVLVDDVTGIEEVVDCHTNGRGTAAYNIGGGQVGNSYRGIVIRNGVKYVNK